MNGRFPSSRYLLLLASTVAFALNCPRLCADSPLPELVEFNRDIRPILSENCFACHGPDKNQRKADLRLDTEEGATEDRGGYKAVAVGKPDESELYKRVITPDDKKRMPPAKAGKRLTQRQTDLIKKWLAQGGKWQKHWSLIPPRRPAVPQVSGKAPPANVIDAFIESRLELEGLKLSPEADRRTLLRRLSFDLIGLPPTPEEMDAFLADQSPDAYDKVLDRLLASKHFGERMALYWLDLVRYGDTGGYHSDNHRDVALYRDYVINAFNDNKPFDRFTMEQLAGDLQPNASTEQKIGSGYNRLLMTTEEGGAQPKEYMAKYAADRVRNASVVWLGLTMGCTECHDHKFDPLKTKEFYQFASFWADIKEKAVGRQDQDLLPTPDQAAQMTLLDSQIAAAQKELATQTPALDKAQVEWEKTARDNKDKKVPQNIVAILNLEAKQRTDAHKKALSDYFRTVASQLDGARKTLADAQAKKEKLRPSIPTTLISMAVPPREMRVLPRGNWLSDAGEVVSPGIPVAVSPSLGVKDRRATRMDLAQWMVAPENPLVARVFVNRLWKLMYGQGIVKTLEDFGSQGAWPTHPELLDWLAVEFRDSGWNVKHLIKLMAQSRTYKQSSAVGPDLAQRDPYNKLLARQARFRLDAEMVRDNALAVSGLLSRKIGGPSAKPYQPLGYWAYLNFPKREWEKDKGEDLYRRGLYTYWCRTFPHPSLTAFDAPSREECTAERPRSNTPLQALVLLNDPTYVEAARVFAEKVIKEGGKEPGQRIQFAYRRALTRQAVPEEIKVLDDLYQQHLKQYQGDISAAQALLQVGDRPAAKDIDPAELAAWTSVARVILNLHETITRN